MLKIKNVERIGLDACNVCQLKCPVCPTALGHTHKKMGKGYLTLENFKKFADANKSVKRVEIVNYGEVLLNKELPQILEYAYKKGIMLTAKNGINFNNARDEVLEAMAKYQLGSATASLDGASQETYSKYRINGNFDNVLKNVKKLVEYKKKYNSEYPYLRWQFIVWGHNEHEIEIAKKMAEDLGMTFLLKLPYGADFSPVKDKERIKKLMGAESREEYEAEYNTNYDRNMCYQLWLEPRFNFDGQLYGCCGNFWKDFDANLFKDGFELSINSEKIAYARELLMGRVSERDDIACVTCDKYLKMKRNKKWITNNELRFYKFKTNKFVNNMYKNMIVKKIWTLLKKYYLS